MRNSQIRRNMTRQYNSRVGNYVIVTTRLTPAEYDTLHFVAYSQRISVSLLVSKIIAMWLKRDPNLQTGGMISNYEIFPSTWQGGGGIVTEALLFYDKPKTTPKLQEILPLPY